MITRIGFAALCAVLGFVTVPLHAQVPQLLNHQGRVAVGTLNFDGTGQFKFALVNGPGTTTYWGNSPDTTPADGRPDASVSLTVTKGLYSVLLGDTTLVNMAAIPASVWTNADVRLRVWFDNGINGSQLLTPDQRLAPSGYLPDGAVTATKLGSDVGLWSVNGTSVFRNTGNVGILKNNPATALDVNGTVTATGFSGSGAGLLNLNANLLDGLDSTAFLQASSGIPLTLTGTSATNLLGATNSSTTPGASAVFGFSSAASGVTYGGKFESASTIGRGLIGEASNTGSGNSYGVHGITRSSGGNGVVGQATALSGVTSGLYGVSDSTSGRGVFGFASAGTGITYGMYGQSVSTTGRGVVGEVTAATGNTNGVHGQSYSTSGIGVSGLALASTGATHGGLFQSDSSSDNAVGVFGRAVGASGFTFGGRFESASTSGIGVFGFSTPTSGATYGMYGRSDSPYGIGVYGVTTAATGGNFGVYGQSNSPSGFGVYGIATGGGFGVYSSGPMQVSGSMHVTQGITVAGTVIINGGLFVQGTKDFRIDHPDDPENKYLLHYSTECPEVINFYRGTVVLDGAGGAVVDLPHYFAKINKTPSYMLTAVGAPMPMLHVAKEIDEAALIAGARAEPGEPASLCSFRIAGGAAGAKVSWRVEAVRNDRWVQKRGAPVEVEKQDVEKGTYQQPDLYGQPAEKGLHYAAAHASDDATRPDPATRPTRENRVLSSTLPAATLETPVPQTVRPRESAVDK